MTPLAPNFLVSDMIKDLEIPIVIIIRPDSGIINQTLLTINHAESKGINIRGVIINNVPEKTKDPDLKSFFHMADTQVKTQDPATQAAVTDMKIMTLGALERAEVEATFAEAKDFRSIGEKITAPLDSIISETAKIIDKDPIMNVNEELQTMNTSVQAVYKEIIDNDGTIMKIAKSIPLISGLAKTLDAKWDEASFNVKSLEGKIGVIFSSKGFFSWRISPT